MNKITLSELSYYLRVPASTLRRFLQEERLGHLLKGDRASYEDVPEILARYSSFYGFQNQKWEIPEWLSGNSERWAQVLIEMYQEPVSYPASVAPAQGRQIHDLILAHQPINVVEIGCFIGISSVWIGSALEKSGKGTLCSVDLFQEKVPVVPFHRGFLGNPIKYAMEKVEEAGLDNRVRFVKMESGSFAAARSHVADRMIDFLFLDGDHTIPGCIDDFVAYYPLIPEGGYILLHDTNPEHCGWSGPRYLINTVFNDSSAFDVLEIPTEPNYGMVLIRKRTQKSIENLLGRRIRFDLMRGFQRIKYKAGLSILYQRYLKPVHIQIKHLIGKY